MVTVPVLLLIISCRIHGSDEMIGDLILFRVLTVAVPVPLLGPSTSPALCWLSGDGAIERKEAPVAPKEEEGPQKNACWC